VSIKLDLVVTNLWPVVQWFKITINMTLWSYAKTYMHIISYLSPTNFFCATLHQDVSCYFRKCYYWVTFWASLYPGNNFVKSFSTKGDKICSKDIIITIELWSLNFIFLVLIIFPIFRIYFQQFRMYFDIWRHCHYLEWWIN
jgi:hypothetical protein